MSSHLAQPAPFTLWAEQDSRIARGLPVEDTKGKRSAGGDPVPFYAPVKAAQHLSARFTPAESLGDMWDTKGRTL